MKLVVAALEHLAETALMLYNLTRPLAEQFFLFNLFRYITFRSGAACLTALVVSFYLGPMVIRWLQARAAARPADPPRRAGAAPHREERHADDGRRADPVRADGLDAAVGRSAQRYVWAVLFVTLGYGALGFADDYLKLSRRNHRGVSARTKLVAQAVIGLIAASWIALTDARAARHRACVAGVQGGADPARAFLSRCSGCW